MSREQLEQYRESLKAIEHEEFSKQNTFKPKTNTARKPAQPRYMDIKSDGKSKANLQRGRSSSAAAAAVVSLCMMITAVRGAD